MRSHAVRLGTMRYEISALESHVVSMNATSSSRILSPASLSGSLYGSGSGVPVATEIVAAYSPVHGAERVAGGP